MTRDIILLFIGFMTALVIVGTLLVNELEKMDAVIKSQREYIDRNIQSRWKN